MPGGAPHGDGPTDWRLVSLLFLAGLLAAGQFAKVSLALDALSEAYPGRPVAWGVTALSLVGMALGVMAGALVARIGAGRAVLGALTLGAAASLHQAAMPAWPVFLLSRLLEGAAHLALVVAAPALMAGAATAREQPVVMGLWGTFFGVAFALTALVAPRLLGMGGLALLFAAHGGALAAVAVALAGPLLRMPPQAGGPLPRPWPEHRAIYGSARLSAPALGFLWHTLFFISILAVLPAAVGAPWTAPLLPLLALAGTFGAGLLARRHEPLGIAVAGFSASVVCAGLMLLVPEGASRVGAMLALMVLVGLVPGACFAAVPRLSADEASRARGFGALAQLGNVGTGLSTPIVAGAVSATGPLAGAAGAIALLSLAGAAVLLALPVPGGRPGVSPSVDRDPSS